jgi:cytochrome P450
MQTPEAPNFPMPRTSPFDPPPAYRALAAERPIFRVKTPRDQLAWVVTRHDDVRAVLLDKRFSSDPRSPGFPTYLTGDIDPPPGFFLQLDPPDQPRLRKLVNREFVIAEMERLRPRMQVILDQLIDKMIAAGSSADLVRELAYPMAATVICEMLKVPYEDHAVFISLTDTVLNRSSTAEETARAATELMAYFDRLVTRRKQETGPADDILGRLVVHERTGEISHVELVGLAALLLLSGYDTMAQMIGLGVLVLLLHPGQLAEIRADPSLVPLAVEELLRYLSINHSGLPRAALEDVEVGGQLIRAGEGVLVMINAANRDQAVFDRPDEFDIHRRAVDQHVAFGHGLHKCIGLTLARVELSTVFAGLFKRLPALQLQRGPDELPFRHEMVLYGVRELPVSW